MKLVNGVLEGAATRAATILLLAFSLGALAAAPCRGQAAPAAAPATPPPPPLLEIGAQFGLLTTTGNTSTQSTSLGADVTYRPNPWIYLGRIAFAQNEDTGELTARSLAGLFRAERLTAGRLSYYGRYGYLRDVFSGIEQRHTIEGGVSYKAIENAVHHLRLDGALGYQKEVRLDADDFDTAVAIAGLGYRWAISPTSELTDESRMVLTFADADAWKFEQTVALTASLTSLFSLKVSNIVRYAHAPVAGFESTDTITSVALIVKFVKPRP